MKATIKKLQILLVCSIIFYASNVVAAESCPTLTLNLYRGLADAFTNSQVSQLQSFLAKDASIYPEGIISGYFGLFTERAVQRWQVKYNIVASGTAESTGYGRVGPRTRKIILETCRIATGQETQQTPPPAFQQNLPKVTPTVPLSGPFASVPTSKSSLIILKSPNGGEVFTVGTLQKLEWQWNGSPTKLLGRFVKASGSKFVYTLATSIGASSQVFQLTIPNLPNGNYIFELCDSYLAQGSFQCDQSDSVITIIGGTAVEPSITVLSPNGGEKFVVGEKYKIVWEWTSNIPEVSLSLVATCPEYKTFCSQTVQPGPKLFSLTPSIPNTGSFEWTIPKTINNVPLNGYYKLIVVSCNLPDHPTNCVSDYNDSPIIVPDIDTSSPEDAFITDPQYINNAAVPIVLFPKGNEVVSRGGYYKIYWQHSTNLAGKIIKLTLRVVQDNGSTIIVYGPQELSVSTISPSGGEISWLVPNTLPDAKYKIEVEEYDTAEGKIYKASSEQFTLSPISTQ